MLVTCWSVKGGSGTTVVAAAIALLAAERSRDVWLVDLAGDAPAVLGAPEPGGPGVWDWLGAPPDVGTDALPRLAVPVTGSLRLLPVGTVGRVPAPERVSALAEACADRAGVALVDVGTNGWPGPLRSAAQVDVLVVRPCYMAMRRVAALRCAPKAVVLLNEPGRSLRRGDVEHAARAPVVAEVDWDPCVARAVDAGLLAGRLPRSLRRALERGPWAP
jgi:hypothetical protein